ncbi:nadh-ubiquinone oxidoreductase ashi subunit [Holotrichia oblita]|uniref:Nadh-ubiquinone oxidoreductase ashi subunit n=1 Tax=Holotrichia oblita TaxID=644536 RepID=A0ACB9TUS9_HOLOL|nr:nadh-ubiquinone oxidoreductase ashi subunit [Holotrichia oblita]
MSLIISKKLIEFSFKYRPSLYISIRNHWDKDYKPLAYPKTKAEREAAAAKYGLSISEYQVYPDDGAGLGDYPQVSTVSAAQRDAFYPWDYPELRRNYGEPFHRDFDLICEERYDLNAKHRTPGWLQWMQFILVLGGFLSIQYFFDRCKMFPGLLPKQYPLQGKIHYTFELDLSKPIHWGKKSINDCDPSDPFPAHANNNPK